MTRPFAPIAVLMLAAACASQRHIPLDARISPNVVRADTPVTVGPRDTAVRDTATRDTAVVPVVSDSEVVARAEALFEGSPSARPVSGPRAVEVRATWDIDVHSYETHDMVTQYIGIFTGRAREYMERSMSRGTRFDALLRRKFRESGLPEDMTYLALIESSYSPHAYSRAAAVGMWQFMASTARGIGMRVDWWVDERRDPMRSTDGAIDFLTDLHDAYGSWYLAAAAYNGGPGRVSRGLKRFSEEMDGSSGEDRFFALAEQRYLPSETKAYVPKLIAAAMIAKEPARYGLHVDTLPPYLYDSANVRGGTSMAAVASASGATLDAIRALNPHFLRGVTPPDEVSEVRIPVGASVTFDSLMNAMPDSDRLGWRERRITIARSAQAIAEEAGIPAKSLRWVNPKLRLDRRGRVRSGTLLRIPTRMTVAGAHDVPDPSIARYGGASGALVSRRVRVRPGESLASVSRRTGVSVAQLRAINGIRGNRVRSGQILVVRRPSRAALADARRTASARARRRSDTRCTNSSVRVKGARRTSSNCASPSRSAKGASSARKAASSAHSRSAAVSKKSRRAPR